jgi:hypothetical protein
MAKNIWIAGTSTVPTLAGNWFTAAVPVDGDEIDIDGRAQLDLAGADQSLGQPDVPADLQELHATTSAPTTPAC